MKPNRDITFYSVEFEDNQLDFYLQSTHDRPINSNLIIHCDQRNIKEYLRSFYAINEQAAWIHYLYTIPGDLKLSFFRVLLQEKDLFWKKLLRLGSQAGRCILNDIATIFSSQNDTKFLYSDRILTVIMDVMLNDITNNIDLLQIWLNISEFRENFRLFLRRKGDVKRWLDAFQVDLKNKYCWDKNPQNSEEFLREIIQYCANISDFNYANFITNQAFWLFYKSCPKEIAKCVIKPVYWVDFRSTCQIGNNNSQIRQTQFLKQAVNKGFFDEMTLDDINAFLTVNPNNGKQQTLAFLPLIQQQIANRHAINTNFRPVLPSIRDVFPNTNFSSEQEITESYHGQAQQTLPSVREWLQNSVFSMDMAAEFSNPVQPSTHHRQI